MGNSIIENDLKNDLNLEKGIENAKRLSNHINDNKNMNYTIITPNKKKVD